MHDAQSCMMHVWRDEMCAAATQDVWLWQDKTSVVARNKGGGLRPPPQRGGGRLRRPPPFVVPLFLATTEVLSCHNQTSCVAAAHISSRHTRDPYPHTCAPRPRPKMCGQRPRILTRAPSPARAQNVRSETPYPHTCAPPAPAQNKQSEISLDVR